MRQVARPRRASCPRPGQRPGGFLCPTPSCPPLLAIQSTAVSRKSLPLAGLSRLLSGVGEALGAPRGPSQLEWGRHSGHPEVPLSWSEGGTRDTPISLSALGFHECVARALWAPRISTAPLWATLTPALHSHSRMPPAPHAHLAPRSPLCLEATLGGPLPPATLPSTSSLDPGTVLRHPPVGHTARLPALCWTRPTPKGGCRLLGGRVPPPLPGVPSPASSAFSAVSTEGLFVELISINSVFH